MGPKMTLFRIIRYILELLARRMYIIIENGLNFLWMFIYMRTIEFLLQKKQYIQIFLESSEILKLTLRILRSYHSSHHYVKDKCKYILKPLKQLLSLSSSPYSFQRWTNVNVYFFSTNTVLENSYKDESGGEESNPDEESKDDENLEKTEDASDHSESERSSEDVSEVIIDSTCNLQTPQKRKVANENENIKRVKLGDLSGESENSKLASFGNSESETEVKDKEIAASVPSQSGSVKLDETQMSLRMLLTQRHLTDSSQKHTSKETEGFPDTSSKYYSKNEDSCRDESHELKWATLKSLDTSSRKTRSISCDSAPSTSSGKSTRSRRYGRVEHQFVHSKISEICKNLPPNLKKLVSERVQASSRIFKNVRISEEKKAFFQNRELENLNTGNIQERGEKTVKYDEKSTINTDQSESISFTVEPTAANEENSDYLEPFFAGPSTSEGVRHNSNEDKKCPKEKLKLKCYPGLSLKPFKVKKDARYQKKFYKRKKGIILPAELGKIIESVVYESRQTEHTDSETSDSDLPDNKYYECAQELVQGLMAAYDEAEMYKDKIDEKGSERKPGRRELKKSAYVESSFLEESPTSESSDCEFDSRSSKAFPLKHHQAKLSPESNLSMVTVSPIKPIAKVSPSISPQSNFWKLKPISLSNKEPEVITIDSRENSPEPSGVGNSGSDSKLKSSVPCIKSVGRAESYDAEWDLNNLKPCSSGTSNKDELSTSKFNVDFSRIYEESLRKFVHTEEKVHYTSPVKQTGNEQSEVSRGHLLPSRLFETGSGSRNQFEIQKPPKKNLFLRNLLDKPCPDLFGSRLDILNLEDVENVSGESFKDDCSEDIDLQRALLESSALMKQLNDRKKQEKD